MNPAFSFYVLLDTLLNLDSLLIQLKNEVTPMWYAFGAAVGIEEKILEECGRCPPDQSLIEVCDKFLAKHKHPTWREVGKAVKQIGLAKLAESIFKVYDTGKLYWLYTYNYIAMFLNIYSHVIHLMHALQNTLSINTLLNGM